MPIQAPTLPTMALVDERQVPITDHPPILQRSAFGIVATINILNPGSPVAPPISRALGISGVLENNGINGVERMKKMAQYIHSMFQQNVGLLALQEVPPPGSVEFNALRDELTRLNNPSVMNVSDLATQWKQTGTHRFGTTILCNPSQFQVLGMGTPCLENRGQEFSIRPMKMSGTTIKVANIHGDFVKQPNTQQFIEQYDGICLGDANINNAPKQRTDGRSIMAATAPTIQIPGAAVQINTLDVIHDSISKHYNPSFDPDKTPIDTLSMTAAVAEPPAPPPRRAVHQPIEPLPPVARRAAEPPAPLPARREIPPAPIRGSTPLAGVGVPIGTQPVPQPTPIRPLPRHNLPPESTGIILRRMPPIAAAAAARTTAAAGAAPAPVMSLAPLFAKVRALLDKEQNESSRAENPVKRDKKEILGGILYQQQQGCSPAEAMRKSCLRTSAEPLLRALQGRFSHRVKDLLVEGLGKHEVYLHQLCAKEQVELNGLKPSDSKRALKEVKIEFMKQVLTHLDGGQDMRRAFSSALENVNEQQFNTIMQGTFSRLKGLAVQVLGKEGYLAAQLNSKEVSASLGAEENIDDERNWFGRS